MTAEVLDRWLRIIYLVLASQLPRDRRPFSTLPEPLNIRHPDRPESDRRDSGEQTEAKRKPETDPAVIAAFFRNSIGGRR